MARPAKWMRGGWLVMVVATCLNAQERPAPTKISATAKDAVFLVDGQAFSGAAMFTWPAGSKHSLEILAWQYSPGQLKTRYVFQHWNTSAGPSASPSRLLTITADPAVSWYNADLTTECAVSLNFYQCTAEVCTPPGTIWLNNVAYRQDTDVWMGAGSTVLLEAAPDRGFIFAGWGQTGITSAIYSFVLNAGATVYPRFAVARSIRLETIPEGLQLLADGAPVTTPVTLDWGWNTVHSLGAVSPQWDLHGRLWTLSSWNDGAALNRTYEVPSGMAPITLVGQFVRAVAVALVTEPSGLPLVVDGTTGAAPRKFAWAPGERHAVTAPAIATDARGNPWAFRAWSNGAANAQSIQVRDSDAEQGISLRASYDPLSRIQVDSVPAGLVMSVDGADCRTPCDVQRSVGSTVRVNAPAAIGAGAGVRLDFVGWEGVDGSTLTAAAGSQKVIARYQTSYRLMLGVAPEDGGTWRLSPASPDGYYAAGTAVSVGIQAVDGMKFVRWEMDLMGAVNPQILAMDAPHAVRAWLEKLPEAPAPPRIGNAAGDTPGAGVAPGSIASLFGTELSDTTAPAVTDPLPQSLGGVSLLAAGRLFPLLYVSPGQINFQVPGDFKPGKHLVEVHRPGGPTISVELSVARNAPGLFLAAHADGSAITDASPARKGETILLFGTGFGPTQPAAFDGFRVPAVPAFPVVDPVAVLVRDRVISPGSAALVSGAVGIVVVQFRLPEDLNETTASVSVQAGGVDSNTLPLAVK